MLRVRSTSHQTGFRILRLTLVVMLLAAMAPAGSWAVTGSIVAVGTVTDSSAGLIEGAAVSLEFYDSGMAEWTPVDQTQTAFDGSYEVVDLYAFGSGDYRVTVSSTGYVTESQQGSWGGTDALQFDFQLDDAEAVATGTVTDAVTHDPIAGAQITASFYDTSVFVWRTAGTATTDSNGDYVVYDEVGYGAGSYRIGAAAASYEPDDATSAWGGSVPFTADFALEPPPVVAFGTITDSGTTDPIEGAYVWSEFYDTDTEDWLASDSDWTDANGDYTIFDSYGRGPGEYRIHVSASGHVYGMQSGTWDGSTPLELDFALATPLPLAQGTITGQTGGSPIAGVSVDAEYFDNDSSTWLEAGNATSTVDGSYTVEDTFLRGTGDYRFTATVAGYASVEVTRTKDSGDALIVDFVMNQGPVAYPDAYSVDEDEVLDVDAPGVLGNDTDAEDDALEAVLDTDVSHGDLVLDAGGGFSYEPDPDWYGTDTFTYHAHDAGMDSATVTVTITVNPVEDQLELVVTPIEGDTRVDTAIKASQEAFPGGADQVVIATAYNWPDALGGAALAGVLDGPILLTKPGELPGSVSAEITRLGADRAVILGGEGAVSLAVETTLKAKLGSSNVDRIAGSDRYETSRKIAARCVDEMGAGYDGTAFVATGETFPDALGASPLAAANGWPIYLTLSTLDTKLVSAMKSDGVTEVLVLGGTSAVPPAVMSGIGSQVPASTHRLFGDTRYKTACAVAQYGVDEAGLQWDGVAVATGQDFPDALAGGVLQGSSGSVMLLTESTSLNSTARGVLVENKSAISEVRFLGGKAAVSQAVRDAVVSALE